MPRFSALIPLAFASIVFAGPVWAGPDEARSEVQFATTPYAAVDGDAGSAMRELARGKPAPAALKMLGAKGVPEASRQYLAARYYLRAGKMRKWRKLLAGLADGDSLFAPRAAADLAIYYAGTRKSEVALKYGRLAMEDSCQPRRVGPALTGVLLDLDSGLEARQVLDEVLPLLPTPRERRELLFAHPQALGTLDERCRRRLLLDSYLSRQGAGAAFAAKVRAEMPGDMEDLALLRLLLRRGKGEWLARLAEVRKKKTGRFEEAMLRGMVARKKRGELRLKALGHFQRAHQLAGTPLRDAMALYFRGRTLESVDRDLEAMELYDRLVRTHPSFPLAPRLFVRMAGISLREGLAMDSGRMAREYIEASCPGEDVSEALWQAGFVAFLSGDFDLAAGFWERLSREYFFAEQSPWVFYGPMGLYWRARALGGAGKAEEGNRVLRGLSRESPGDYYGLLAAEALAAQGEASGRTVVPGRLVDSPLEVPEIVVLPGEYAAAVELFRLGLWEDAYEEFRHLIAQGLLGSGAARLMASSYFRFNSLRDAISYRRATGLKPVPWEGGARLWRQSLRLDFLEAMEFGWRSSGLPLGLIGAIIRFESNFSPAVKSHAGAIGLLQVKKNTGDSVAVACLGERPVKFRELTQPLRNLQLGSIYIAGLLTRHHGNWAVALAAFNAGPGVAGWWLSRFAGLKTDEFVEQITYPNTVGYVKRILAVAPAYWSLYYPLLGTEPPAPGLTAAIPAHLGPFLKEKGGACDRSLRGGP